VFDPAAWDRVPADSLTWVSVDEMREVDRIMIEDLGISLERMMENAGRSLAVVARAMLGGDARGQRILVLAGAGGNGGGGLAAARHLVNAGALVDVRLTTEAIGGVPGEQLAILRAMGLDARASPDLPASRPDLIVDALLGYGQRGAPHGATARLVAASHEQRVLALDVPTGLGPDSGEPSGPAVRAEATLTLAAPKRGLRAESARPFVGRLLLADISVPAAALPGAGTGRASPFARGPVVEVAPPTA